MLGPSSVNTVRLEMQIPAYLIEGEDQEQLTIIRRPTVTYNGEIFQCRILNGTFLEESSSFTNASIKDEGHKHPMHWWDWNNYSQEIFSEDYYDPELFGGPVRMRQNPIVRLRRHAEQLYNLKTLEISKQLHDLRLACGESHINCALVQCDLRYFRANAKAIIELKLRLKNKITGKFS